MTQWVACIFALVFSTGFHPISQRATVVLKGINVVNVKDGNVATHSIVIEDEQIKQIGRFDELILGSEPQVIDCRGKFLIPGLFDMHVHIFEEQDSREYLESLLAKGVTAIRDMGGNAEAISRLKARTATHAEIGPDIYFAGPTLDGVQSQDPAHKIVDDVTDIKELVSELVLLNVDFIKVHNFFPANRLEELITEARKVNLGVVGHIPAGINTHDATSMGMDSVEHVSSILRGLVFDKRNDVNSITDAFKNLNAARVFDLSRMFVQNETAFTPTLHVINKGYQSSSDDATRNLGAMMMTRFNKIVLLMKKNDVLILAGSDIVPIDKGNVGAIHDE